MSDLDLKACADLARVVCAVIRETGCSVELATDAEQLAFDLDFLSKKVRAQ